MVPVFKIRPWWRRLRIPLGLALLAWLGACTFLYIKQDQLVFPDPGTPFEACGDLMGAGGRPVAETQGGQSLRYYVFDAPGNRGVVLLFHGNAGSVCTRRFFADSLRKVGLKVYAAEYPGYGGDPVPPSQERILQNALAMASRVREREGKQPMFLFGESLGTGPATWVAGQQELAGLILDAAYPSLAAVGSHRYPLIPVDLLLRHPFHADRWAPAVRCPVLQMHGIADQVIPYELGRRQSLNFSLSISRFVSVEKAGHDSLPHHPLFWQEVRDFVTRCLAAPD